MRLEHLKIRNFRNLEAAELEVAPETTILFGRNGAGKTNTLEAAHLALCGKSFRTRKALEMVMEGEVFLRVEARGQATGATFDREVALEAGGAEKRGNALAKEPLPVVCFTPDDLSLVKGPPAQRRKYIDRSIARKHPRHGRTVADLEKALMQRNSFLERAGSGLVGLSDISPWDKQVAALSARVYQERFRFCKGLEEPFRVTYREISGNGTPAEMALTSQMEPFDEDDIEAELLEQLKSRWQTDMEKGTTGLGAHRDDVDFRVGGRNGRSHGSRGEQRLAVLALLLAEVESMALNGAGRPLVMLDDVMSELDPARRRLLMERLKAGGQVIITATDRDSVPGRAGAGSDLYEVDSGCIRRARTAINV